MQKVESANWTAFANICLETFCRQFQQINIDVYKRQTYTFTYSVEIIGEKYSKIHCTKYIFDQRFSKVKLDTF